MVIMSKLQNTKAISPKTKTLISILLFAVIFVGLLVAATFTDLQVSKILTKNALPKGEYLANDFFGVFFEIVGSSPIYLMIALCTVILFWYFRRVWKLRPLKDILAVVFYIAGIVAFWFFVKDIFNYTLEHAGNTAFEDNAAVIGAEVAIAILLNLFAMQTGKNLKEETLKKLLRFVVGFILVAIIANVIIMIVKVPVGRMRFRAMNSEAGQMMGGFDNFTRWYVITGNNDIYDSKAIFGVSDAFKSFPSGHTCAAGMSYGLIMLIDALDVKDKRKRFVVWFSAIAFTGLVAISRIVVGAHYFSDVLMGGTIAFATMIVVRELVVNKCANLKALFKKNAVMLDASTVEQE